ncbi:hypothetical protein GF386_03280 [Candidatus Pacearchaeota archaeon]|nr:hypothetical protein [Candidatus Pacearchaeota archaeon]MBD3283162.1 hypothetical protein [Candidatus Pacearchaeota archaeon]
MGFVHILTDKDLMSPDSDGFINSFSDALSLPRFGNSLEEYFYYRGFESNRLNEKFFVREVRGQKNGKVHNLFRCYFENDCIRAPLVLVNMPIAFQEVSKRFLKSLVAGCYQVPEEISAVVQASGVDDPLLIGPELLKNGIMQYDKPLFNYLRHVRGVVRTDDVDFVVAEEYRKRVAKPGHKCQTHVCLSCSDVARLINAELYFGLGFQTDTEDMRDDEKERRVRRFYSCFGFPDSVADRVDDWKDFPVMNWMGRPIYYCSRWSGRYCEGFPIKAKACAVMPANKRIEKYREKYLALLEKVKISSGFYWR